jgi:excisionase family DNA binding protein
MSFPVKNIVYDLAVRNQNEPGFYLDRTTLRFVEVVNMPFMLGDMDGFRLERLIADGCITNCQKQTGEPFANSSGLFRQVLDLGEYGWYLAAIPPGTIFSSLIAVPEDIAIDIFLNTETSNLIFGFYNPITTSINITAKLADDRRGVMAKIKANPTDIELRNYFLKQCLARPLSSTAYEEKIPELMTHDEASVFLGISTKTLYNWVSERKIAVTKVGKINKFRKKDLDSWLEKHTQVSYKG